MNTILLICLICGGALLLLIIAIIFIRKANKKRFKKLQENLQKYKAEKEEIEHDNKITLSKDDEKSDPFEQIEEKPAENKANENKGTEPLIEDYIPSGSFGYQPKKTKINTVRPKSARDLDNKSIAELFAEEQAKMSKDKKEKDEFEDFLDEHAYSRRILNKDILSKIQNLPPEIKAVILSNVFNKYDDEK